MGVWDSVTSDMENKFLNAISKLTGVPRGVLELTKNKVRTSANTNAAAGNEEMVEYRMSLDQNAAVIFKVLVENNILMKIANYSIEYAQIDGQVYNLSNATSINEIVVNNSVENDDSMEWSVIAFITLLVINVIGVIIGVVFYCKNKKSADRTNMYNQF